MFTQKDVRKERVSICKACPHYNRGFCGVPFLGDLVDNPEGGRRKRTCGCNIRLKAELEFEECGHPFEKRWFKVSEKPEALLKEIGEFIDSVGNRITKEDKVKLFEYKELLTGYKGNSETNCRPCIIEALKQLKKAYQKL